MSLTIGQLAKKTGLAIDTIRFYEREKLIPCPPRRLSGYRQYSADILERVFFIREAKALGFTLTEIAELLALRSDPERSAAEVKEKANAKIADIDHKILGLQKIRNELSLLAADCTGQCKVSDCPILEGIASKAHTHQGEAMQPSSCH